MHCGLLFLGLENSKTIVVTFSYLGTLSIDDEMGRQCQPEVKFSRANLPGMRQVVKTSSTLRRR